MKEFHLKAPKARLFLRSMNCYDIRDELLNGTLDIGVFYEDVGGFGSSLVTYEIGTFPTILLASPETQRQFPDFIKPDQVLSLPLVINEPNCIFRQMFEEYLPGEIYPSGTHNRIVEHSNHQKSGGKWSRNHLSSIVYSTGRIENGSAERDWNRHGRTGHYCCLWAS